MQDNPKCFMDTNIWLYAFISGNNREKTEISHRLIKSSNPIISIQVINEICVNLIKQTQFTEEHIRKLITSFYATYPVIIPNQSILLKASSLRQKYILSFWDSMIIASALASDAVYLYSEDMQHDLTIEGRLVIRNPFVKT